MPSWSTIPARVSTPARFASAYPAATPCPCLWTVRVDGRLQRAHLRGVVAAHAVPDAVGLDHRDPQPGPLQQQRGGEPGDARPDHRDVHGQLATQCRIRGAAGSRPATVTAVRSSSSCRCTYPAGAVLPTPAATTRPHEHATALRWPWHAHWSDPAGLTSDGPSSRLVTAATTEQPSEHPERQGDDVHDGVEDRADRAPASASWRRHFRPPSTETEQLDYPPTAGSHHETVVGFALRETRDREQDMEWIRPMG